MRKSILSMGAVFAILFAGVPATAADFSFSFTDDPTTPYFFGRTHVPGTVTGILHGLADSGFSTPLFITITDDNGAGVGGDPVYIGAVLGDGFEVQDDQIISANVMINIYRENAIWQLRFNRFEEYSPASGLNLLFNNAAPGPWAGTGNQGGFSGATYLRVADAAPEPATWAMMIIGFGLIGATLRSSRRVTA